MVAITVNVILDKVGSYRKRENYRKLLI